MITLRFASTTALALTLATFSACGSANSFDTSTSDQDLASQASPLGMYGRMADPTNDDRWVDAVNLHADGTFDASFGWDVSNLSGHQFYANGTYALGHASQGATITFTYGGEISGQDDYFYRFENGVLELKLNSSDLPDQSWFTLTKYPSPVAIAFASDWTESASGSLTLGSTVLVRYSSARAQCGGDATVTGFSSVDGGTANAFSLPPAVKGNFDAFFQLPTSGHDIAFWFESKSGKCTMWDSNFGKNYHFTIR